MVELSRVTNLWIICTLKTQARLKKNKKFNGQTDRRTAAVVNSIPPPSRRPSSCLAWYLQSKPFTKAIYCRSLIFLAFLLSEHFFKFTFDFFFDFLIFHIWFFSKKTLCLKTHLWALYEESQRIYQIMHGKTWRTGSKVQIGKWKCEARGSK